MHLLVLDSNCYRELGVSFQTNIDFRYLSKFLAQGPHELVLLDVVFKELVDYFKTDYISKLISDYQSVILRFEKNDYLQDLEIPALTKIEQEAILKFKRNLEETCWKVIKSSNINSDLLVDFLLYNKRESKKDNVRDFLIWLNVISLAKEYSDDRVILISRDKIFTEHAFFKNLLITERVSNIIVVDSVPTYLSEYGLQIDFLNNQQVLESIDVKIIEKELKKEIKCFPSYISSYYDDLKVKPPKNISLEILDIDLYEYYTYSEEKSKVIIVSSFIVKIRAIYDIEKRVNLKDFEKEFYYEDIKHRIDIENRPIYENYVLFMFEGEVDLQSKQIINQVFDDFIPDWNVKKSSA